MPPRSPTSIEPVMRLTGITKRFAGLVANDDISFALGQGEIVALLGENGAGKTTLMNILFGHYVADAGYVEAFGKILPPGDPKAALDAGIGMVHQHFTLADNLTVLDNIVLGTRRLFSPRLDRASARKKIAAIASDFGLAVDPGRPVGTLAVGERQRVEIVKALYRDARVLILDEPTAVLTPGEAAALFSTLRAMAARGLSVIFISHKLNEVMAASDRVVVLRGGRVVGERRTAETSREDLAHLMVGREVPPPRLGEAMRGGARLRLDGVTTDDSHGTPLDHVSLELRSGEITGVAGVSGNGQGSLAALLSGLIAPVSGTLSLGDAPVRRWSPRAALGAGIGRIPEDRHTVGAIGDMSVAENAVLERLRDRRFSRAGFLRADAIRDHAAGLIEGYQVKCPSPEARIRLLSGGNMQKLILGRALDGDPSVILASQPTRGLDVGAVAYVQQQLLAARARGAAILLISEDLDEIFALSDRICVMFRGRMSEPFDRASKTPAAIGAMMAGQGFETEQAA
ncbi:MAG: ABC transporter ATP-binding protein [Rhizobiaceae bacterium]|nr:ABC transporter ATP-binding protein [Rhizobiaceae bacterium]MCV0406051.1 ABC transporter ATP-binding protein [Rhizobiaceae bacterium]